MPTTLEFAPLSRCTTKAANGANGSLDAVAFFPWSRASSELLYDSNFSQKQKETWKETTGKAAGAVASCGGRKILLFRPRNNAAKPIEILWETVVDDAEEELTCLAWCLDSARKPVLVVAGKQKKILIFTAPFEGPESLSILRGHGGAIMTLVAHRRYPHIVFSASRDRSIRIHDLRLSCDVEFVVPRVPLPTGQYAEGLYGPTFGMPLTEEEGSFGVGKCIGVFTGGEVSHGHKAAVLNADVHPKYDLLASCGLDHALNIWLLPELSSVGGKPPFPYFSQDKPLFNTTQIHSARVISVYWLSDDTLISQSASSFTHAIANITPPELVVWTWLGHSRFVLSSELKRPDYSTLQISSRDFSDSRSFLVRCRLELPEHARPMTLHEGLVLLNTTHSLRILVPSRFPPHQTPSLQRWQQEDEEGHKAKRFKASPSALDETQSKYDGECAVILGESFQDIHAVSACGSMIVGVGSQEGIQVWVRNNNGRSQF